MHIMVACFIRSSEASSRRIPQDFADIDVEVAKLFKQFNAHSPLPGAYVVQLEAASDRDTVIAKLLVIGRRWPHQFQFVATPIMRRGSYDGLLPPDDWEVLNELSKEESILSIIGRSSLPTTTVADRLLGRSSPTPKAKVPDALRRSLEDEKGEENK